MKNNKQQKYRKTVLKPGTISITKIVGSEPCPEHRIIRDRKKLILVIKLLKKEGLVIGYTGGVWDQIHDGHVKYTAIAKSLCDILVVGVDDDEFTRQRKPNQKNRPIDTLETRLTTLVYNRCINILTPRTVNESMEQLIIDIRPDVAVFSKTTTDADEEEIKRVRGPYCGKIVFLEPQSTNSSTQKIRKVMMNGANDLALHLKEKLNGNVDVELLENAINDYFTKTEGGTS
jgi:cytidyltransferase-like protein